MATHFDAILDDYLRSRRRGGFSPESEKSYRWAYADFRRSLMAQGADPDRLSSWQPCHLEAWQDGQVDRLRPQSRALSATAVRGLLQWGERQELPVQPELWRSVTVVKVPRGQPRPLSEGDLRKLLAYLARRWPGAVDRVALRDRALILYLIGSAGRISEVLQVQRADFEQAAVIRKGGHEGVLMIPAVVVAAVEAYLAARTDSSPWLWVGLGSGRAGDRLTAEGVRHVCAKLASKAAIQPFSPHQLRHTAATSLLDAGIQEAVIANHLGHHGLGTLQTYAEVRPKRRAEALSALQTTLGGQAEAPAPAAASKHYTAEFLGPLLAQLAESVDRLEARLSALEERPEAQFGQPFALVGAPGPEAG